MIKYLTHQEIDKEKWDSCIATSNNASFYALSGVLDITSPNWNALIYGDYIAVFPLPWRKKFGKKYIYPPFFSTQLGLYSSQLLNITPFINAIPKEFLFIEIKSNTYFPTPNDIPIIKKNRTYYLDLNKSADELVNQFSKNHKRNIQIANKNRLSISKSSNIAEIIQLFIDNKGHISSFKTNDYNTLHQLIVYMGCNAEVWSVYDETNTLCAGGFFITAFNKVHFLFSGSNKIAIEKRAMFYLFSEYIKINSDKNLILDFGGSNDENLARFYKGFGSTMNFYDTIRIGKNLKVINWLRNLKKLIRL